MINNFSLTLLKNSRTVSTKIAIINAIFTIWLLRFLYLRLDFFLMLSLDIGFFTKTQINLFTFKYHSFIIMSVLVSIKLTVDFLGVVANFKRDSFLLMTYMAFNVLILLSISIGCLVMFMFKHFSFFGIIIFSALNVTVMRLSYRIYKGTKETNSNKMAEARCG